MFRLAQGRSLKRKNLLRAGVRARCVIPAHDNRGVDHSGFIPNVTLPFIDMTWFSRTRIEVTNLRTRVVVVDDEGLI
jgi:hypothetical protein